MNELQRYDGYLHRWTSHKKAGDVARLDYNALATLESYYSDAFEVRTADADFLGPTLMALMLGRSVLSWSYVREFYQDNKKISVVERNMWDHNLSELEMHVDRLQEQYENGKKIQAGVVKDFLAWKQEVINLTRVAKSFFDSFCEAVIRGNLATQGGSQATERERFYALQLKELDDMGFAVGRDTLVQLLDAERGDVQRVANRLL